jgi:hypothetical protein
MMDAKYAGDKEQAVKLLRELTSGFVGCTDAPHNFVVPELVELYPDAKVVLVTRDPQRWWASFEVSSRSAFSRISLHRKNLCRTWEWLTIRQRYLSQKSSRGMSSP